MASSFVVVFSGLMISLSFPVHDYIEQSVYVWIYMFQLMITTLILVVFSFCLNKQLSQLAVYEQQFKEEKSNILWTVVLFSIAFFGRALLTSL